MICFYHNDFDGRCSGAIVKKWFSIDSSLVLAEKRAYSDREMFVEVDYKQQNIIPAEIIKNESVFIVDFHFTPDVMRMMCRITSNIFVFDHHKTAKEVMNQYPKEVKCYCDPENEYAGCELVWNFLFSSVKMPRVVELIADRDKWAWKYGEETAWFNEGLKLYSHQPEDKIWFDLLCNIGPTRKAVEDAILEQGKICLQYRDMVCKEFRNQWGFEVEFEGYKCYVMNLMLNNIGSEMFAEKLDEYDICIGCVYYGDGWKVFLKSNGKVDVSEIAKKWGGSGHQKVASFIVSSILYPF